MKVRIAGNSIRFRLKQSEVNRFKEEGEIRETVCFGIDAAHQLSFVLNIAPAGMFELSFEANTVTVQVPEATSRVWTGTELVGFEKVIATGKGACITVLVEKDFKCLDGNDAADEDAYPNPNLHC